MGDKKAVAAPSTRSSTEQPPGQGAPALHDTTGGGGGGHIPGLLDVRAAFDAVPVLQGIGMGSAMGAVEFLRGGPQGGG